jgi:RimJ/RimL family protein N-acetyltransferase
LSEAALTTKRLRLLPLAASDFDLFRDLFCDADTMRHVDAPMARRDVRANFRATLQEIGRAGGPCFFRIESRRTRRALGVCALQRLDARARRIEVGIVMLAAARGRGYAAESVRAVTAFAFGSLPIDTVWVQYRAANAAAARLFAGLGFRPAAVSGRRFAQSTQRAVMQRSAWRASNQPTGESTHVEHDPFSRERGQRRRPAPHRRQPSASNDA